jgi:integrase/recombinase XerC
MDLKLLYLNYLTAEKRYSEHTSEAYLSDIKQFEEYLKTTYNNLEFAKVSHLQLRSWFAELRAKGIQPRSVRRKISSLNTFYKFLKKRNLIDFNPVAKVISPKIKKRLPVTVRESDLYFNIEGLIDNDQEYKVIITELIVFTLYTLGIRRSELINLKIKDVHLKNNQLKVMGKGGKERIIPFGNELRKNLERYFLIRNNLEIRDSDYLFLLPNGKKLYPKAVYLMVNNWLSSKTSLGQKSPHILRHSFATHLADHGAEINAIKELLGHANLSATQIYTHNSIEQLKRSYLQAHPRAAVLQPHSYLNKIENM